MKKFKQLYEVITILFIIAVILGLMWISFDVGWHSGWSQRHQIEVEIIESRSVHPSDNN